MVPKDRIEVSLVLFGRVRAVSRPRPLEHSHRQLHLPPATMFKKPLADFKTSGTIQSSLSNSWFSEIIPAPLRTSDRKKLRQRVVQEFSLSSEVGELLVPEGLLSVKYTSHSRVPGVRDFRAIPPGVFLFDRV